MSLDNTTMMEIYPYGGILAYIKYHYIDGLMKQTIMLTDKTRIDYDREKRKAKMAVASNPKDDKELQNILANFGIGKQTE